MSTHLDWGFDRESPIDLAAGFSPSPSPVFAAELASYESLSTRRPSLTSCSTASPETFLTPPARNDSPTSLATFHGGMLFASKPSLRGADTLHESHSIFQLHDTDDHAGLWMGSACTVDDFQGMLGAMPSLSGSIMFGSETSVPHAGGRRCSDVANRTVLTESIFQGHACRTTPDRNLTTWTATPSQPPVATIEPRATFQQMLPSSPAYKAEPSTPIHAPASSSFWSIGSPLSLVSPPLVLSQPSVRDDVWSPSTRDLRFGEIVEPKQPLARPSGDRLHRRVYERKRVAGAAAKAKAAGDKRSGVNCDLIIATNEFACTYPGCTDKNTGKPKRFRRQEHKKRHEKTVHEKEMHCSYVCWVPECRRAFSRTDNLKSHLRNTHSKRPGVRGNRYVATLDKHSGYYDPDWVGELDKHGFPLL